MADDNYKEKCAYCMKHFGKGKVRKCSVCEYVRPICVAVVVSSFTP